jgi:hypothetical protein
MKLIPILLFIFSNSLFASYFAECDLEVKFIKFLGEEKKHSESKRIIKAELIVTKFIKGDGHDNDYCKDFKNKKYKVDFIYPKANKPILNKKITIYYQFVASEIIENDKAVGLHESTTWSLEKER